MSGLDPVAVFGLVIAAWIGFQVWMRRRARSLQGQPAPALEGPLGAAVKGDALLFFHSPGCAPCRAMRPHVEALAASDPRVHSLDVQHHMAAARAFSLLGTPTTIAVRQGQVVAVKVGAVPPAGLGALLARLDDGAALD